MSIAHPTAAPVEFQLRGGTVTLHPLNFREWGMIERWMREEIISVAKESLKDRSLGELEMRVIIREGYRCATRISIHSIDALEGMLGTLTGMLRIAHLSLRKGNEVLRGGQKELTLEQVDDLLGNDVEALSGMVEKIYEISFPEVCEDVRGGVGDGEKNP